MTQPDTRPSAPVASEHDLGWTSGLRAVCAFVVLIYHGVLTPLPDGLAGRGQLFIQALAVVAHSAVLVFVILSGYLLGGAWWHKLGAETTSHPVRKFVMRRSWRLLPAYWVALGLTIIAMLVLGLDEPSGTHWDTGLPFTWGRALVDALLISDFVGQTPLSHQLWTVPVEYHLYLTCPLIVMLARKWAVAALACLGTVTIVALAPGFSSPFFFFAFVTAFWVSGQARQARRSPSTTSPTRMVRPLVVLALLQLVGILALGHLDQSPQRFVVTDTIGWAVLLVWLLWRDMGAAGRVRPPSTSASSRVRCWPTSGCVPTPSTWSTPWPSSCAGGASSCGRASTTRPCRSSASSSSEGWPPRPPRS